MRSDKDNSPLIAPQSEQVINLSNTSPLLKVAKVFIPAQSRLS
jgi:hypothetical protein